jgi:hypothetical protein
VLEVDGIGSGSCRMAGFCISGVEPSDTITRGQNEELRKL